MIASSQIDDQRKAALERYGILDTPPDAVLDGIAQTAANLCETPIALISFIDLKRQWFKACIGLPIRETSRDVAFCTHTILYPDAYMEIEDATKDDRFSSNPLVTEEPKIRFYAGMTLLTSDNIALGTLCVIDDKPRRLSAAQRDGLSQLAKIVMNLVEDRKAINASIEQGFTEHHRQEEMILLRDRAIESVDVGVTITDATRDDHPLVYVNQTLCDLTGYSADELLGRGVRVLQKGARQQPEHLEIQKAQAKGEAVHVVFQSTRKDGTHYMDELSLSPVHNSAGQLTHYIGINRDVTLKLETEAQLRQAQKIEAIGQLSGGVAHDFNNLLTVIIGNLELLDPDLTVNDQREYLIEAQTAAQMGARLTHRLLTFAKKRQLEPAILNVNEQVVTAIDLLSSTIGEAIKLSSNVDPDLWSILADPSEVENTLVNLAINARDAMVGGGEIIFNTKNVSFSEDDINDDFGIAPGDYVQLAVTDNGCGMTEEVKSHIFEPFYTTKDPDKGSGLGLASIYGFIKQSGGHVHVYSEPGYGTTINLYLPRHLHQREIQKPSFEKAILTAPQNTRILVVEDNDVVRKITIKRLQKAGFKTEEVCDGPAAVQHLEIDSDFDLVFSDIVMGGGMSGYDLARWVRINHPNCKILLTSGFSEQLLDEKNAAEFQVLSKPYSFVELQEALSKILRNE